MSDIALDLNPASPTYKDLLITNNDLSIVSGSQGILQDIIQNISFFLGEWFLDNTQGLPWFQQILVKNPDQSKIDAIFQNAILNTPGVEGLNSYAFTVNSAQRILSLNFTAQTTSGTVSYNGNVSTSGVVST